MPKLKRLSQKEVIRILEMHGFVFASQKGSHIKMKRIHMGSMAVLTIPNHKEIDIGTLKAIFNQAREYISEDNLRKDFYTD